MEECNCWRVIREEADGMRFGDKTDEDVRIGDKGCGGRSWGRGRLKFGEAGIGV